MGIFSGKKKTYVSSVVYNMAGDEFERPNYLRTTVASAILGDSDSISESIVDSYLNGPATRFRSFYRWTDTSEYGDLIGLATGSISTGNSIDEDVVEAQIPGTPGAIVSLQRVEIGVADYTYWADKYVVENFPELINTEYSSDINEETDEITITWEDTTTSSFMPVDYDKAASYLYAIYVEFNGEVPQDLVEGTEVDLYPSGSFPDTTGWTVISFSDDGMGTTHGEYERTTFVGPVPNEDATYSLREYMYQDETPTTKTYQIDTQEIWHSSASPMKVYIYKYNSGNSLLDDMWNPSQSMGGFYPPIPFRLNNKFISEDYLPEVYEEVEKAYKKATTGDFDDLVEELEDNESLGDIDYAYVVFGVCLNVLEQSSRKYIYQFFKEILNDYVTIGTDEYEAWQVQWAAAKESWDIWVEWREAQTNPLDPLYGTTAPTRLAYPEMPANSLRVSTGNNPVMNYDITISWNSMSESEGFGELKADAEADELWFTQGDESEFTEVIWGDDGEGNYGPIEGGTTTTNEIFLNWQITEDTWRRLRIVGLKHRNLIYGGKSVDITAAEALDDGEESGFIIPLHDGVFRSMGMVNRTQMTTACCFMVFNCYQVVKQKWYQTTIFKIILIIIVIVVAYFTGGASLSASGGVLGANAVVGAAIIGAGASALVTAIVGAVANAIAAILITKLVTAGATALFGEKWGAIIGAIASVIALQVGTSMASGQTFANSFSGMMRADNLIRLTEAAGKGYSAYIQGANADLLAEQEEVLEEYEKESREVRQAWVDNLGGGNGVVDPLAITDIFGSSVESVDSFLQRTLMTGSDIADMSLDLLTNFADITLDIDLPTYH